MIRPTRHSTGPTHCAHAKRQIAEIGFAQKDCCFWMSEAYLLCQHAIEASEFSEVRFCVIDNSITAQENTQPRSACWVLEIFAGL
jgi:hypothetical protein